MRSKRSKTTDSNSRKKMNYVEDLVKLCQDAICTKKYWSQKEEVRNHLAGLRKSARKDYEVAVCLCFQMLKEEQRLTDDANHPIHKMKLIKYMKTLIHRTYPAQSIKSCSLADFLSVSY